MSKRPEITKMLSLSVRRHINQRNDPRIYWAAEVTFDYGTSNAIRVDFMRFKPVNNTISGIEKGDFYCYEVKSSVQDFHSRNGHNFIGDFNYYVMPEDVYEQVKNEIPHRVGAVSYTHLKSITKGTTEPVKTSVWSLEASHGYKQ